MDSVGIISCTKRKRTMYGKARIVYSKSSLFRKAYDYCKKHYDHVLIASAKYGIIDPDHIIAVYDHSLYDMTKTERKEWGLKATEKIIEIVPGSATIYFHTGALYREAIIPNLENVYRIEIPLEGLGLGEQLRWYNEQ